MQQDNDAKTTNDLWGGGVTYFRLTSESPKLNSKEHIIKCYISLENTSFNLNLSMKKTFDLLIFTYFGTFERSNLFFTFT